MKRSIGLVILGIILISLIVIPNNVLSKTGLKSVITVEKNEKNETIISTTPLNITQPVDEIIRSEKRVSALVFSGSSEYLESSITIGQDTIPIILDTSSHHFLIAKKKCDGCTQFPPFYRRSPVAEFVQCDSQLCHLNGNTCEKPNQHTAPTCVLTTSIEGASVRAYLMNDMVSVDNFKNIPVIISAIYKQNGGLPNKLTKPIFGVGPSCSGCPVSQLNSILTTLKKPYIFGVSLDKNYFGGISLGSINPLLYTDQLNYTSMIKDNSSYSFRPYSMISHWNNRTLNVSYTDFNVFTIQTTLPLSYLPTVAFNKFTKFLIDSCQPNSNTNTPSPSSTTSSTPQPNKNNNSTSFCSNLNVLFTNCLPSTMVYPDRFPIVDLIFPENFTLSLRPSNYLYSVSRDSVVYQCIGIQETTGNHAIFGLNLMRELYTVFDNDRSIIGFGKKQ